MKSENIQNIKYTLASEGNSVIRDIKILSNNYLIDAYKDDLVTFFTQYPDTLVEGLYWGRGLDLDFQQLSNQNYLYTSEGTVRVSKGVALDSLDIDRLPMYAAYLTNIKGKVFTIKSIYINGVEVSSRTINISNLSSSNYNISYYVQDYMSYTTAKTLEYSVVASKNNVDTTLTASVDLSKDNKLLIDCSIIE